MGKGLPSLEGADAGRRRLVIWGAGGHARVVCGTLKRLGAYEIVGFLDNTNPDLKGAQFGGSTILGGYEQLETLRNAGVTLAFVAIGDNTWRLRLTADLERYGFDLPVLIHPQALVEEDAQLGPGTFVAPGAVVAANSTIGKSVIVNHLASVDHDCTVDDGVHLSPGARLAGRVRVGRASWIGMNASIRENIRIGSNVIVGAGAVVIRDIDDGLVACGVPARPLRTLATTTDESPNLAAVPLPTNAIEVDETRDSAEPWIIPIRQVKHEPHVEPVANAALLAGCPAFAEKLYVGRPNIPTASKLLDRIELAIQRRWLTNDGPFVCELERRISQYLGGVEVVTVANATLGLQLTFRALNLSGEVLVPAMTFVATAHALEWEGLTPVFCEVDAETQNIDPDDVLRRINERTTAIVGVHLWGRPCPIDRLTEIAQSHGLRLIFDAAHAFGCSYKRQMIGGHGDAEVFSFHATKFVNTLEGGAIATSCAELASSLRLMRNFGFSGVDQIAQLGTNAKMDEFSAAMGLACLDDMDVFLQANERNYHEYCKAFADFPGIRVNAPPHGEKYNYQYVIIDVDPERSLLSRDELARVLWANNVIARRYFYPGCHRVPPYSTHRLALLPITDRLCNRLLALPTGTAVSVDSVRRIGDVVRVALEHHRTIRETLRSPLRLAA